jgi:hypothetical protein
MHEGSSRQQQPAESGQAQDLAPSLAPKAWPPPGSWLRRALGGLLCHASGAAVHSFGEASVRPLRCKREDAGGAAAESAEGGCRGASFRGFGCLPDYLLECIFLYLRDAGRPTHFSVW